MLCPVLHTQSGQANASCYLARPPAKRRSCGESSQHVPHASHSGTLLLVTCHPTNNSSHRLPICCRFRSCTARSSSAAVENVTQASPLALPLLSVPKFTASPALIRPLIHTLHPPAPAHPVTPPRPPPEAAPHRCPKPPRPKFPLVSYGDISTAVSQRLQLPLIPNKCCH
jgi:hypothetical protein